MKNRYLHYVMSFGLLISGCQIGDINHDSLSSVSQVPSEPSEYDTFWDPNTTIAISVDILPFHLSLLEQFGETKFGIYNDLYVPAHVRIQFSHHTYEFLEVGVRQKGGYFSRGSFLTEEEGLFPFHLRLRFNYRWNDDVYENFGLKKSWDGLSHESTVRRERLFLGMRTLEMKWNRSDDPSMINQVYASHQFQLAGVIAPKVTLASFDLLTGNHHYRVGVYTLYETIDQRMIARHFDGQAARGDLYKALYPNDLLYDELVYRDDNGVEQFHAHRVGVKEAILGYFPTYDLKTNTSTSTHGPLMNLVRTLRFAHLFDEATQWDMLQATIDVPSFLRYAAISYLIGHPDDMRMNKNNTYIYFHGVTQKAYFIPYDFDWSLGVTWDEELTISTSTRHPLSKTSTFGNVSNPLFWFFIIGEFHHPQSLLYPLHVRAQNLYIDDVINYFESNMSLDTYAEMFAVYALHYGSYDADIPSNTRFRHALRFIEHYHRIAEQVQSLR